MSNKPFPISMLFKELLPTCIPSYMMINLQHGHLQKRKQAEWETLTYRTIKLSNRDKTMPAE